MIATDDCLTSATTSSAYVSDNYFECTSTATSVCYESESVNKLGNGFLIKYPNYWKYVEYIQPGEDFEFDSGVFAKIPPKPPRISPKLFLEVEKELEMMDLMSEIEVFLWA